MNFSGFTIPDGAYLPPELIHRLPHISGSKLKAVIAILYHNVQFGGGEPLSLSDVERYTGLSHQAAISALRDLMADGMIEREWVGQSYVYRARVQFLDSGVQKLDWSKNLTPKLRESDSELSINNSLSDSLNLTSDATSLKIRLVKELRAAGVYLKTAQGIVEKHAAETIEAYMSYYRYALEARLAQGPGWLVEALKEQWGPPLGYKVKTDPNHVMNQTERRAWLESQGLCPDCEEWLSACVCEAGQEI